MRKLSRILAAAALAIPLTAGAEVPHGDDAPAPPSASSVLLELSLPLSPLLYERYEQTCGDVYSMEGAKACQTELRTMAREMSGLVSTVASHLKTLPSGEDARPYINYLDQSVCKFDVPSFDMTPMVDLAAEIHSCLDGALKLSRAYNMPVVPYLESSVDLIETFTADVVKKMPSTPQHMM